MIQFRRIAGTSPATASTAVVGDEVSGLSQFSEVYATATYAGNSGGTLLVRLQRFDDILDTWVDWVAFAQAASGGASATYSAVVSADPTSVVVVGTGTSPALAASTVTGGHPGDRVRCIAVSGASTSAGTAVTISLRCRK